MKRLLYFLILFSLMVLNTGCKKSSEVTAVTSGLSFKAEIISDKNITECNVTIAKNGSTEITVTKPKEISGLTISYNGSRTFSYNGLTDKFDGNLPIQSDTDLLYDIFSDAEKGEVKKQNDTYFIKGKIDKTSYTMTLGGSGIPIKITTNTDIEIIIKDAKIKAD